MQRPQATCARGQKQRAAIYRLPNRPALVARRREVIAALGAMVGRVRAEQRELAHELERIDAAITRTTITPTTPAVVVPIRRVRR